MYYVSADKLVPLLEPTPITKGIVVSNVGSVSQWIDDLKHGDAQAAERIWKRYKPQMSSIARSALNKDSKSVSDEEDAVICAFAAFLRCADRGAFHSMRTRNDLWPLLATITRRYAWKQSRFFRRHKRRPPNSGIDGDFLLSQLASKSPPPDVVASLSETMNMLLSHLRDPELRQIAVLRLEGQSAGEIAQVQSRSVRTIERRLSLIHSIWKEHLSER